MQNDEQCSILQLEYNFQDDELSSWMRDCFIQKFDIEKILYRLDNDTKIKNQFKYLPPTHQQFDFYYYLIQTISDCADTNQNTKKYLEYIVQSQSFQNLMSERCHLIITQAKSIDNLEDQIELLFQIFFYLKDIDMNILKQSNISQLFTLQKIIEINYPEYHFNALFYKLDQFLCLIQESAEINQYKNIPAYPQPLEFIQFKDQNKQIFGKIEKLILHQQGYLEYLFNILREDYVYDIREQINYLSEKGFYKPINRKYTSNIDLYQDIRLISFEIKNLDILWKISLKQFNLDGRIIKQIDWNDSKKLKIGSLICITNIECHPLLFAIITDRSQQQDDYNILLRINLEFRFLGLKSQIMEFLNLLSQQTILMECKTYTQVESQIYQLESIKKIKNLPFQNLITNHILLNTYSQILEIQLLLKSWPSLISTLDELQLKAVSLMVYKKLALIQGLPGTGKTYCGILAVRILIQRKSTKPPILIICQNSHTLDHFLENLIQHIPINQIVRLGGTSQSAIIQKCMFQSRSKIDFDQKEFQELKEQLNIIFNRLIQYDYTINAQDITKYWFELRDKLIQDFIQEEDLDISQIDESAQNQILNSWINTKCPFDEKLQYETQLFGVKDYFEKEQIIKQVNIHNIFGTQNQESNNQQDQDQQPLNCSSQNKQSFSPIEQFNNQNQNQLNLHYNFKGIEKIQECLQDKTLNLWKLNYIDICEIIKYIKYLKYQEDCLLFEKTYKKYKKVSQTLQELNDIDDIKKLNEYKIIGVTVTDAGYYTNILQQLNTNKLIIEEADEVLESDITTILPNKLERLILIGNHVDLEESLKRYHQKNLFLYKRLQREEIPKVILSTQRRMKTTIADFVRSIYRYDNLDHQDICQIRNKQEIIGLNSDLLIFNHHQLEQIDSKSKENSEEAEMIFQMVQYLIQVGYKESQISILSLYQKQVQRLKQKFINQNQQQIEVQTVDNYLGEENDIVIISLVINNNDKLFQKIEYENRIKIAFSRAKLCLYVFGNFDFVQMDTFEFSLLKEIIQLAKDKNCYSDIITLKCQTHGTLNYVQNSNDWFKFKAGCCEKICNLNLDKCLHTCQQICHLGNHLENNCQEKCERILKCRHKCQQLCQAQCICTQMINVTLPICNHTALINCRQDPAEVLCNKNQTIQFLKCKHIAKYKCYQREAFLHKCQHVCEKVLQCGHSCPKKCWEICQPCEQKCIKIRNCGHKDQCQNLCYQSCSPCTQKISVKLNCGKHNIQKKCFKIQNYLITNLQVSPQFLRSKIGHSFLSCMIEKLNNGSSDDVFQIVQQIPDFKCRYPCSIPRQCGHNFECKNFCSQECTPCYEKIMTLFLDCGHEYQVLCKDQQNLLQNLVLNQEYKRYCQCECQQNQLSFQTCNQCREVVFKQIGQQITAILQCYNNYKCQQQCIRIRQCGHKDPCLNECGEKCSPCQQIITKILDCGHQLLVECSSKNLQCNKPCDKIRACSHYYPCSNYCSQPCSPCQVEILINLPCKHQTLIKCYIKESKDQKQQDNNNKYNCELCQSNF